MTVPGTNKVPGTMLLQPQQRLELFFNYSNNTKVGGGGGGGGQGGSRGGFSDTQKTKKKRSNKLRRVPVTIFWVKV